MGYRGDYGKTLGNGRICLAYRKNRLIIQAMYDLTTFTLKDMTTCGAALRQLGADAASMEEAANRIIRYLYDHLVDADGERATALVRFFITRPYHTLSPDLQQHVNGFLPQPPDDPELKCQTLLATIGDNPVWHSRHKSRFYKVHPLSKEIVDVNPMFGQVSQVFGIVLEQAVNRDPGLVLDLEQETYNILHVPDARDNAYVPDQADFVIPYGIRSVLVMFSLLPSGNIFTIVLFAKVVVPRELIDYFRPLTLNVKMAILPFDDTAVFTNDPPIDPTPAQQAAQFRSQAASLNQLLGVHERVVQEQSDRIARMVAEAAVTEERNRLARDLHDSVTQALYSQTLYAEAAIRQLEASNSGRAADHLHQLKENAQQALREMRLLIFELRPSALEAEGLVAALRARLEAVEGRTGVETAVTAPADLTLSPETETGLYWIAQEALNNALKYARADKIEITLTQEPDKFVLSIADNGVGFATSVAPRQGSLGLRGMQERAAQLGWQLVISSAPGQGTTIQVEVPHA
ncbi:MAG: sensor histidine kinase [Ardenticatenaceae bacterium]|nr:sensor histidine kinase [Ardenticatenaceae bacterium]